MPSSADSADTVNGCSKCAESESGWFSAVLFDARYVAPTEIVHLYFCLICMYFAVDSVVKQGMKVATNLAEIVTLAGFQRSQNFTAYFWTSAL